MNPHQKNKVDIKSLSPEEQRLFRLYGKLPSRSDHFAKHLKERKYFDSGDYAMSKAGKGDGVDAGAVGSQHPVPENIPHLSSPISQTQSNSSSGSGGSNTVVSPGTGGHGITPLGANLPKHHGGVPGLQAGSPVKESSFLQKETSVDDVDKEEEEKKKKDVASPEPLAAGEAIPIRR